jgi:hypothetical protein
MLSLYVVETGGAGAALGGGAAFFFSIGEASIGIAQMVDAFNGKPNNSLYNSSTLVRRSL